MTLTEFLLARIDEDAAWRWHVDYCRALDDGACDCQATERVLAECEAKRRIVNTHPFRLVGDGEERQAERLRNHTLRLLALPYAEHPDYRQEWTP